MGEVGGLRMIGCVDWQDGCNPIVLGGEMYDASIGRMGAI